MELHVWGTTEEIAFISADCLATIWYMALTVPYDRFKVKTSSNVNLSPNGELPILIVEGEAQYNGFTEIIRYLVEQGYDLNKKLNKEQYALNDGVLVFLQDKFNIITDYSLYLNKLNYEKYTRGIFTKYLSFPLQYNTPLSYRSDAKKNCGRVGLTVEDKTEVEQEILQNIPTVSKIHQMKTESLIEDKLIWKNSLTNMKCLNLLVDYLNILLNLKTELNSSSEKYLLGSSISTADLVLIAHLFIQTNSNFPDQFITKFLESKYPSFLTSKTQFLDMIEPKLSQITIEAPGFNESPNLLNFFRYAFV